MEAWKIYLNKEVKVIYDDGGEHPSKKTGILINFTDTHLFLKKVYGIEGKEEALLLSKILRVEIVGEPNGY